MPQGGGCCCGDNRESGGSPERSGHCEQGVLSWDAIAWRDHVRRFDKAMICESGNLLGKLVMSFRRKQNSKRSKSIFMFLRLRQEMVYLQLYLTFEKDMTAVFLGKLITDRFTAASLLTVTDDI